MPTRIASPARRPDIEDDLDNKYHVEWSFLNGVNTDQFDLDKSLANQARHESIDAGTVEIYKEGVERGDPFPAVLAYRPGRATLPKLVIIDGNHRLSAHVEAGKLINVYEIDRNTKSATIMAMMYAFNAKHGKPLTEDERVTQAINLIDGGSAHEAAAAALNVPVRLVKKALNKRNSDTRAIEAGIDPREWDALSIALRSRLLQAGTDEGFLGAAHLAFAANLTTDETNDMIVLLNQTKSGAKQKSIIRAETDRLRERIQDNAGGQGTGAKRQGRTMSGPQRIGLLLSNITAMPDDMAGLASGYRAADRKEVGQRVEDASQKLHKLALELRNPTLS